MRFRFGEFQLDDKRRILTGPAGCVELEPQVFELLHYLVTNHDRVVAKEELLEALWGDRSVSESELAVRVDAARQAVGDPQGQQVIRAVDAGGYRVAAEVRIYLGGARRALPKLRTAPIGRDEDIAGLVERIRSAALVTVTGSGGIGKTTVALAVANRVRHDYGDGVVFVDLSLVQPGADVTRAVAAAAEMEGAASETMARLADHLANRPVLVVLDNCEHVLGSSAELVGRILQRRGLAHIVATSREPLGVAGEHVWPLGPLHGAGPALFVERARAAEPRVDWDPADPAVVQLCRRLDGVPLGLELAAGQLRRFDLDELTRRLDDRLVLLSGGASDGAPRHATMETTIDWSYRLLETAEQRLLRSLGVFPSSFDVASVEACAPPLTGAAPVRVLGQLVDKSLVVRLPGSGRYRLLETIRMFARDRLEEAEETAATFERHRCHVRDRISGTSRLDRWMSGRLAGEYCANADDARQAFRLSLERGALEDAVEIAIGACFLWRNARGLAEGTSWLDQLDALDLTPRDRLWAHLMRADVGEGRGDHRQVFGAAARAKELVPRADDVAGACLVTYHDALAHFTDVDQARDHFAGVLGLAHRSGDPRLVTFVEAALALADVMAGHRDRARAILTDLDRDASEDNYDWVMVNWAEWLLGLVERDAGAARRWVTRQHDHLYRTGLAETWTTSFSTAMCEVVEGGDVRGTLAQALVLADREGYRADSDCLLVLAFAELCEGRVGAAAELVGTAMRGRFGSTGNYVVYRTLLDGALQEGLSDAELVAAMERGRARTPAAALAEHGITRRLADASWSANRQP